MEAVPQVTPRVSSTPPPFDDDEDDDFADFVMYPTKRDNSGDGRLDDSSVSFEADFSITSPTNLTAGTHDATAAVDNGLPARIEADHHSEFKTDNVSDLVTVSNAGAENKPSNTFELHTDSVNKSELQFVESRNDDVGDTSHFNALAEDNATAVSNVGNSSSSASLADTRQIDFQNFNEEQSKICHEENHFAGTDAEFNADFQETSSRDNYIDFHSNLNGLGKAEASAAVSTNEENSENTLGEEKSINSVCDDNTEADDWDDFAAAPVSNDDGVLGGTAVESNEMHSSATSQIIEEKEVSAHAYSNKIIVEEGNVTNLAKDSPSHSHQHTSTDQSSNIEDNLSKVSDDDQLSDSDVLAAYNEFKMDLQSDNVRDDLEPEPGQNENSKLPDSDVLAEKDESKDDFSSKDRQDDDMENEQAQNRNDSEIEIDNKPVESEAVVNDTQVTNEGKTDMQGEDTEKQMDGDIHLNENVQNVSENKVEDDVQNDEEDDWSDFTQSTSANVTATADKDSVENKTADVADDAPIEKLAKQSSSAERGTCDAEEDDDEWADFTAVRPVEAKSISATSANSSAVEDGATGVFDDGVHQQPPAAVAASFAFDDGEQVEDEASGAEGDNWAAFASATSDEPITPSVSVLGRSLSECVQDVGRVAECCLPELKLTEDVVPADLHTLLDTDPDSGEEGTLWQQLCMMEQSSALHLQWTSTHTYHKLLSALNIDAQKVLTGLKKPVMPAYAAQLGLLQPSVGVEDSRSKVTDTPSHGADFARTRTSDDSQQDIPAVEFDWLSSGLSNPLDASSTAPLDLTFFACDSVLPSVSAAIHREKELMESLEHNAPVNTSQPLESILANFKPTATVGVSVNGKKTNSELSDEAKKVLLRLPDLSFMKARVLMFPVKQS